MAASAIEYHASPSPSVESMFSENLCRICVSFFRKAKGPKRPRHSGGGGIHGITRKSIKIWCECRSVPWHRKTGPYLFTHTKLARGGK